MTIDIQLIDLASLSSNGASPHLPAGDNAAAGADFKTALAQAAASMADSGDDGAAMLLQQAEWNQSVQLAAQHWLERLQAEPNPAAATPPPPADRTAADELPPLTAAELAVTAYPATPDGAGRAAPSEHAVAAAGGRDGQPEALRLTEPGGLQVANTGSQATQHAPLQATAAAQSQASMPETGAAREGTLHPAVDLQSETQNPRLTTAEGSATVQAAAASTSVTGATASAGIAASQAPAAPLGSGQWQQDFGQQISHMVRRGDHAISMNLNPPELGQLLVDVRVSEQSAQLQFASQHAAVRSAVEQAIPQLRDALAEQGIALGQATVGDQRSPWSGGDDGSSDERRHAAELAPTATDDDQPAAASTVRLDGRVSLYV